MPTALPSAAARRPAWREVPRLLWLLYRLRRLTLRMDAESLEVERLGVARAGDALLRTARLWLACHDEIATLLLHAPEPPQVSEVRAALGPPPASPGRRG